MIDRVTELHASGGWRDYWRQDITAVAFWPPAPGYEYSRVHVTLDSDTCTQHTGDGSAVRTAEPEDGTVVMLAMRYVDGHWVVGGGEVE